MNAFSSVPLLLTAVVLFAGIQALELETIGDNYTSYRLQVPGSNKSITIIEANTAAARPAITPEHVQQLRDRHYLQQQQQSAEPHAKNASHPHGDDQYYYDHQHQRPQHGNDDDDDHNNRVSAKVNQPAPHDYAAAASVLRSPSSSALRQQQQRYHYPTTSSSSIGNDDRYNRHHDVADDVRASIALNVYDRDDDADGGVDEFIQPHAADNTFLKKRKVAVGSTPTAAVLQQHRLHHHDGKDDDSDRSLIVDADRKNATANKNAYSPLLLQQFIKTYTAKLKLGEPKVTQGSAQSVEAEGDAALNRRYNWNDNRDGAVGVEQPSSSRPGAPNPFNDQKGWVTLEAVPWSSSKVSKWHAHVDKTGNSDGIHSDDSPSSYYQSDRPVRPHPHQQTAAALHYDDIGQSDDEYVYSNRPQQQQQPGTSARPAIYTTYNPYRPSNGPSSSTHRPTKYTSATAADSYYDQTDRPYYPHQRPSSAGSSPSSHGADYFAAPEVEDNFHHHQHRDKWYEHNNDSGNDRPRPPQYPQRPPWHEADIITDNRPYSSDFPKHPAYAQPLHQQQRPPQTRPASSGSSSSSAYNLHDRFDSTHPDSGHGEWVLVSSNKGYQAPPVRHGQRAIHLRPVYGDKSPSMSHAQPGNVNDLVSHHSVRLTVLPPLPDNDTFSSDRRRPQMVLSHGGLLEVESSFDTVDNSVASAFSSAAAAPGAAGGGSSSGGGNAAAPSPPTKPKRRVFKGVPLKSRTGSSPDASAVIAAVSAGMVPATMAMMMPIVLGRKRREATVGDKWNAGDGAGVELRMSKTIDLKRHR